MNNYINIGKLVSAFGLTGEVVLKHALGKKTIFKQGDALFIEQLKGSYLPYFIQSSKAKTKEETYVKLEGVDSREKALKLIQKNVWLQQEDFRKLVAKNSPLGLLGYTLVDEGKTIGKIDEVIEQPHQVLLQINIEGKEALIPLHEETLVNVDHKKNEVYVTLPEGLLDIYLSEP
jgi:16S rRNA processing protein RimM